jgi:hypothetical protein
MGLLGRGISPSQGHYLHRKLQHIKTADIYIPRAGFEPTIPLFERVKTVRALDGAASGTGTLQPLCMKLCLLQ